MRTGIVKWRNAQNGFGFIQPWSGGAAPRGLAEGQKIGFALVVDSRSGKSSANRSQVAA